MASANTVEVTDANFKQLVLESPHPVLVDFWAAWCGPCLAIAPSLEELGAEYQGKVTIAKLDVDSNPVTSQEYRVMNIPTMLVFKNGQIVDKQVGGVPKSVLKNKLEAAIAV
jgi:thioredoxin 1